ncbi:uncharacterized protein H6S33_009433 [Morchella sextelata]|uniref:uncharacterized protein n=1 Tax=Morchella sextelata TaxID=1174677 RepID=UPI001D047C49|nr:uncharacterized protein H6S33_009433 [Morchella sextelata]KAH0613053.1 hypothetical protein H6S33_009433 [Morchella sextelata]
MTIQMGTLSQTRSLLFSCLLTALVVYTLSTRFSSPPRGFVPTSGYSPELGRPYGEDEEVIPHGISVFKPDGYRKHLVLPRMSNEDVSWLTYLPPEMMITPKPYIVDADLDNPPVGAMTTPINKGHEVLVYLTYIIEHYDHALPDIIIFVHAHSATWHNNDLQLASTPVMLLEMNYLRVLRHGYVNLRCHWQPGCPAWIRANTTETDINKPEEAVFRQGFQELFPGEEMPDVFSTACCAQFAVTADTIRKHPKERYVKWRQWIIDTELEDNVSGRIWEYLWQFVFPGPERLGSLEERATSCPKEHVCYCDGYGYCFGGEVEYEAFMAQRRKANDLRARLQLAEEDTEAVIDDWRREGMDRVRAEIKELDDWCEEEAVRARIRGKDPRMRKLELGSEFSG